MNAAKFYRLHVKRWILGGLMVAAGQMAFARLEHPQLAPPTTKLISIPAPRKLPLEKRVARLERHVARIDQLDKRIDARLAERISLR